MTSTACNPATNGLAEAFNRTIIKLLKKFISTRKWDWNKKFSECLWACWMRVWTPTSNTPFFQVYGCEAFIPLEIKIPSLRVALTTKMTNEDNHWLRHRELEALDEKRLQAQQCIEFYQAWTSKPSTERSKREFSRREIWYYLSDDLWSWHRSLKANSNPNRKDHL